MEDLRHLTSSRAGIKALRRAGIKDFHKAIIKDPHKVAIKARLKVASLHNSMAATRSNKADIPHSSSFHRRANINSKADMHHLKSRIHHQDTTPAQPQLAMRVLMHKHFEAQ